MVALLITLLLFDNGPVSRSDFTKCLWHVQINRWSVYKIVSCCVWQAEEKPAKWLASSSSESLGVMKSTVVKVKNTSKEENYSN